MNIFDKKFDFKSQQRKTKAVAINKELLDILACPKCKGTVQLNTEKNGLVCDTCKLLYRIQEDIPVMLIDEASPVSGPEAGSPDL